MTRALVIAAMASVVLVAVYLVAGGAGYRPGTPPDPCTATVADTGTGAIDAAQRIGLKALNRTACRLGVRREELLLSLTGERDLRLDTQRRNDAFRAGVRSAIDEEEAAGRLDPSIAGFLRAGIDLLPIDLMLNRLFPSG